VKATRNRQIIRSEILLLNFSFNHGQHKHPAQVVDHFPPTEDETTGRWVLALVGGAHARIRSEIGHGPNQEDKMQGETGVEGVEGVAAQVN